MIISCLTAFGAEPGTIENITGVLSGVGACIAYMLAEGMIDVNK